MRRIKQRWGSRLGRWVERRTVSRVVKDLAAAGHPVTRHAVYKWVRGARAPQLAIARTLIELGRGSLTLGDLCPTSREDAPTGVPARDRGTP
jgi:hypothetical protein